MKTQYNKFRQNNSNIRDPKPISKLLSDHPLSGLISKAKKIVMLNQIFMQIVPIDMASHCQIINYDNDSIIVEVENAAFATRLRYSERLLIEQLRRYPLIGNLKCLQYRIQKTQPINETSPTNKKSLTPKSRRIIQDLAENLQSPELKESLLKLAKN